MNVFPIVQPHQPLGIEIQNLLESPSSFSRIIFVSAFVSLRTLLRLRESIFQHVNSGAELIIVVGIDLGGTSKEVLDELLKWGVKVSVFHNPNPRSTFHPKIYLFERPDRATLFIGSNNLTDGGFYTNCEAATCYDFILPSDNQVYQSILSSLSPFLFPVAPGLVQTLNSELIQALVSRGTIPYEDEARRAMRSQFRAPPIPDNAQPNPFTPFGVKLPPLLPIQERNEESASIVSPVFDEVIPQPVSGIAEGVLVWQKTLPKTDALQVNPGTAHVGGVRLVKAGFKTPDGEQIDQTQYFRQLFADYTWEVEAGRGRRPDQEHTFVPIRLVIRGFDYGTHNFEISHKPSGEAAQHNYTTILRWGPLTQTIQELNVTGCTLFLYEVVEAAADFLVVLED